MTTYRLIRFYLKGKPRTIRRGLTLKEAMAHCDNPETSSATCKGAVGKARTRRRGQWFDGFDLEAVK